MMPNPQGAFGQQGGEWRPERLPLRYLPRPQTLKITFDKGVDESQSASVLPPGFLAAALNWSPEPTGALRARRPYTGGPNVANGLTFVDTDGTQIGCTWPGTKAVHAIAYASMSENVSDNPGGKWWVVDMWNATDNAREIWGVRADWNASDLLNEQWQVIYKAHTQGPQSADIPFVMAKGKTHFLMSHPKISDGIKYWDGTPGGQIKVINQTAGNAGRALAYHKGYFFTGGSLTNPETVYFSAFNNDLSWPATNKFDVGYDDQFPIEDMVPYQNNLVIGKKSGVWILSGADLSTFQQTPLPNVHVCGGRSLIPTPFGLVILGEYAAWLWTGGAPQLITPAVESSYALGAPNSWRTGVYCDRTLYVFQRNGPAKTLAFDMVHGTWSTQAVSDEEECGAAFQNRLLMGPTSATLPFMFRDFPGSLFGLDYSNSETFSAKTPEFWVVMEEQTTPRHMMLHLRQLTGSAASSNSLMMTQFIDGVAQTPQSIAPRNPPSSNPFTFRQRVDVGRTGFSWQFQFDNVVGPGGAIFDIEGCDIVYDVMGPV